MADELSAAAANSEELSSAVDLHDLLDSGGVGGVRGVGVGVVAEVAGVTWQSSNEVTVVMLIGKDIERNVVNAAY